MRLGWGWTGDRPRPVGEGGCCRPLQSTHRSLCPAQLGMPEAESGPEGGGCTREADRWRRLAGSRSGRHRLSAGTPHSCLPSFLASLCARRHTHTHTLTPAAWGAPSVGLTPFPVPECWTWPHLFAERRHLDPCTTRAPQRDTWRETGAKIETSMCVRRGTCSDKHLWKQTHASRASGSARRDAETHMCRHAEQHGC